MPFKKSVQLAIEITTKSQEAEARHHAERLEQGARGVLERQKIEDESLAETSRRELLGLQAKSMIVESTGAATAEANATSAAQQIHGEASVEQANFFAEAQKLKSTAKLALMKATQEAEIDYQRDLNKLEIKKAKKLAEIEADKFKAIVDSIGANTLQNIASSGPTLQQQMLQSLGLKSFMITDGTTPINLFNTAGGVVGPK